MSKARLFVIGGCNGSGKSSYAKAVTPIGVESFDYDKEFLKVYNAMYDSELRAEIAHNKTRQLLKDSVTNSIKLQRDFCYETNFNSTPMHWPEMFRAAGFELNLFFFCLDSVEKAKERVRIRVENGGHFVPDNEIEERYKLGFENLDRLFAQFDFVHLFDSSFYKEEPHHILSAREGQLIYFSEFPEFLKLLIPTIAKMASENWH
ncbi:zeta toxin family protein [uncultured Imperialibacter sp.]|uniref:zeta toxin family protein n=1 Tax=uncultured Imperialibacter sp. TaxID=1672639 RepID=UPI0030DB17A9|tara:strand:- start:14725 stop:15339 length:615 start_codon:yes stop_codon:yes gene_type:complete